MPRLSSEASQEARHGLLHHDELQPCSECRESRSRPRTGIAVHLAQLTAVFSIAFVLGFFYSEVKSAQIQSQDGLLRMFALQSLDERAPTKRHYRTPRNY